MAITATERSRVLRERRAAGKVVLAVAASALKRALAIYRNPGWRLNVLFIEGSNGERMEAAEINDWCERAPPQE